MPTGTVRVWDGVAAVSPMRGLGLSVVVQEEKSARMPSPLVLQSVKCAFRERALQGLAWLISSFLGPDPNMSLREACAFRSTALLDWLWSSSCTSAADRSPGWSLTNFLRSERHYQRFQFVEAAKVAARRGDLPVLQWLHTRFPNCEGLPSVIYEAAVGGHLEVVQFLIAHGDASPQIAKVRKVTSGGDVHARSWVLGCVFRGAVRAGHYAIARWVDENGISGDECSVDGEVICRAVDYGGSELAELLVLPDNVTEKYTTYRLRDELIRPLLDCCSDGECASRAMRSLAKIGRLDLMQQVSQLHPPAAQVGWSQCWKSALRNACERNDVPMIQWLLARPYWHELDVNALQLQLRVALTKAAAGGGIAAMEYLYPHELLVGYRSFDVVLGAIRNGHMDAVKWLLMHGWQVARFESIYEAAKYGHVEMMQLLYDRRGCYAGRTFYNGDRALSLAVENGHLAVVQWLHDNEPQLDWVALFELAAFHGHLEMVQWLHENRRYALMNPSAIRSAAAHGHLEVVRWMHSVEPMGSMARLLDCAAEGNNLELVQWLHENTDATCTTEAMDFAAKNGNLAMLKWLHAHRREGCTAKAIQYALCLDDTRVASWLVKHFPFLMPQEVTVNCQLDVLMFVRVHFPRFFQPEASRQGTTTIRELESCSAYVRAWLEENYGGQTFRSTSEREITF
jgi:hypothetical protein